MVLAIRCNDQCASSGTAACNCWTWSTRSENAGCWLKNYSAGPNATTPLLPADTGLFAGTVAQWNNSVPEPFNPVGYAFRNTSAAGGGITHVVVWDALPELQDADRVTRCNVTVAMDTAVPAPGTWAPHTEPPTVRGPELRLIVLGNGSVYELNGVDRHVASGAPQSTVRFELDLYDAPILVARGDAVPGYTPTH